MSIIKLTGLALASVSALAAGCGPRDTGAPPFECQLEGRARPVMYVLDGGTSWIKDKGIFHEDYAGQGPITLQVRAFLIVHPAGVLLWDTGHSHQLFGGPREEAHSDDIRCYAGPPLPEQLAEIGLAPEDVDLLAFSHWHFDHTGNANLFRNATITGQRDEYEYAFSGLARRGSWGMTFETYAELEGSDTDVFLGDRDVFGDGSVRILRVGGHTVGSQVLYVDLAESGPVLLSGDLYHFAEQRERRRVP
ncbi:MAG: N-acyl homoserine lactonase family protein, partial [Planctomycetota bacterium]